MEEPNMKQWKDAPYTVPNKDMWVGFLTCEDGFAWGGGDSTKDVLYT